MSSVSWKVITVRPRDLELEVELAQLEVGLRDAGHQREHHAAPERLRGQELAAGGLARAPDPAPHVDLPDEVHGRQEVVVFAAVGRRRAQEAVLAGGGVGLVAERREELAARDRGDVAGLLDARGGRAQVEVALQRLAHQIAEGGVLEDLPPGEVRERGALRGRLTPEGVGLRERRALVVRPEGAAGQRQRRERAGGDAAGRAPHSAAPRDGHRRRRRRGVRLAAVHQAPDRDEEHRDEEDPEQGGDQHAHDHGGAELLARDGAGAARAPERDAAEDEGEGRHQDRPQAQARALQRRLDDRLALPPARAWRTRRSGWRSWRRARSASRGRSARRRSLSKPRSKRPKNAPSTASGVAEQHAERQRPALVQRGQDQEHEQHARARRPAAAPDARFSWYDSRVPVVAHLAAAGSPRPPPRARPWPGPSCSPARAMPVISRRAVEVEAVGELGPAQVLRSSTRVESGTMSPVVVAHVEAAPMSSACRRYSALGLEEDLPLPAEAVEVVHVGAAQEGLQRLVDARSAARPA